MEKPNMECRFSPTSPWEVVPPRNIDRGITAEELLEFNELLGWEKWRVRA